MPKKRNNNFKQLQGSSSTIAKSGSGSDKKRASVNEQLGELRALPGKDSIQKKRELVDAIASNQRSVPPSLRGVLGISESAPPKPKRGVRTRISNRTPGPAPPKSWLKESAGTLVLTLRGGGRGLRRSGVADKERIRPKQLLRFDRLIGTNGADLMHNKPSSLLHIALKTAAEQWSLFDEDDFPTLVDIPLRLRCRLLSYLGQYGPPIDWAVLDALTQGSEAVTHLDLSGNIGDGALASHQLVKFAKPQPDQKAASSDDNDVLDSWDQDVTLQSALTPPPSASRLWQLTHLSLSHPAPGSSWRDLLALSKHISNVTHLSLAYWPRPTRTPNLATSKVTSPHSPDVVAGGSHYYSGIDNDLVEPASLLRQLSSRLLRLQWLDLEGCAEWVPALSFRGDTMASGTRVRGLQDEDWSTTPSVTSIFVHNWKNVQYINLSQGWAPSLSTLEVLPRQSMTVPKQRVIRKFIWSFDTMERWKIELAQSNPNDSEKRKAEMWLDLEMEAHRTEDQINSVRRAQACPPIAFDNGWAQQSTIRIPFTPNTG